MRVLVTGATGFMGSALVRFLVEQGHQVRALARRSCTSSLIGEAGKLGIELAWGDVVDLEAMQAAVDGADSIFHLAAQRDVWGLDEANYERVNVQGTRHLLEAARSAGVRCFVYCSSVGVARYPGNLHADESLPYAEASSQVAYHCTKAQAEREVLAAAWQGNVPALVVRPVITYGPGDRTGMITQLLARLERGTFFLVGNGRNHVDLAYVGDMVKGMALAWEQGRIGQVYILSGPRPVTMWEVLTAAHAVLGKGSPHRLYVPASLARLAAGGLERVCGILGSKPPVTLDAIATLTVDRGFSHARASSELGYHPEVELLEGFRQTATWLRECDGRQSS